MDEGIRQGTNCLQSPGVGSLELFSLDDHLAYDGETGDTEQTTPQVKIIRM